MSIQNSHDKFIKDILSELTYAVDLLKEILPSEIRQTLDWNTISQESDSFVDDEFHEYFSDALFSVDRNFDSSRNQTIQLYLLFEHKSSLDKRIHFQLLNYLSRIYSKQKQPVIVIPIVFYHGQKTWKIPVGFVDIFDLSKDELSIFRKYIPNFEYTLYDLSHKEMHSIQTSAAIYSVLHIMKYIWNIENDSELLNWVQNSQALILDDSEQKILVKILTYVYIHTNISKERMFRTISKIIPEKGEIAMSTAEKLRAEGKLEGRLEGELKGRLLGKLEAAKGMLDAGAEEEFVLKSTGLTKEDLQKAGLI